MTLSNWIVVLVVAIVGPILGAIASGLVKKMLSNEKRPEALKNSADAIASLFFWLFVVVALIIILGVFRPTTVDKLADDFVEFIPKALVAAIILIGANVLSTFAVTAMQPGLARMPLDIQQKANLVVKAVIVTFAVLLAVSQVGIDTEIVNMAIGAILFFLAASMALLIGLGGRPVAQQVSASRSLQRVIEVGDTIEVNGVTGEVASIGPTHVQIKSGSGEQSLPSAKVLKSHYVLTKNQSSS